MAIAFTIIIGLIIGTVISLVNNKLSDKKNNMMIIIVHIVEDVLAILGSIAGNQLVVYGPRMLNVYIVPSLVGGIVMSLVILYAGKKWLNF